MKIQNFSVSKFLGLSALLLTAASAQAQIIFTATGTANDTRFGYITGQTYTFSFTTGPSFANNADSYFIAASQNNWTEDFIAEGQLFTSITGPNLTGTLTQPSSTSGDPYSYIVVVKDYEALGADAIDLTVTADVSDIGLTVNGGLSAVKYITVDLSRSGTTFTYAGSYVDPITYFQGFTGTYDPRAGSNSDLLIETVSEGLITFAVDSFTIGPAPVPEPSSYALAAGLVVAGVLGLRRRRS